MSRKLFSWAVLAFPTAMATCSFTTSCAAPSDDSQAFSPAITGGSFSLVDRPRTASCPSIPGELIVSWKTSDDWHVPLVAREVGFKGGILCAKYSTSSDFGETRILIIVIGDDKQSVLAMAAFDTDYGFYLGSVDEARSTLHKHNNSLCFDIQLRRLDGSATMERWRGEVTMAPEINYLPVR